jgi:hypothetical protein
MSRRPHSSPTSGVRHPKRRARRREWPLRAPPDHPGAVTGGRHTDTRTRRQSSAGAWCIGHRCASSHLRCPTRDDACGGRCARDASRGEELRNRKGRRYPPAFRSTMHNVEALLALLGRLLRAAPLLAGGLAARLLRRGLLFLGSHDSVSIDRSETARPIPRWIGGAIRRQRTVVSLHGLREAREVEVLHLDGRHHDIATLLRAGESH